MNTVEVTFTLPAELATRARKAGKLTTEYMIQLLEKDLEREFRVSRLFATMDRLQAVEPPVTEQKIEEEIALTHLRIDVPNGTEPVDDPWLRFGGEWGDENDWEQFEKDIRAFRREISS